MRYERYLAGIRSHVYVDKRWVILGCRHIFTRRRQQMRIIKEEKRMMAKPA
jgi:hypothetical protein